MNLFYDKNVSFSTYADNDGYNIDKFDTHTENGRRLQTYSVPVEIAGECTKQGKQEALAEKKSTVKNSHFFKLPRVSLQDFKNKRLSKNEQNKQNQSANQGASSYVSQPANFHDLFTDKNQDKSLPLQYHFWPIDLKTEDTWAIPSNTDKDNSLTSTNQSDNNKSHYASQDEVSRDSLPSDSHSTDASLKSPSRPFFFARLIIRYPKTCFFATLGLHLILLMSFLLLYGFGSNVLPLYLDGMPNSLRDNVDYLRGLAWSKKHQLTTSRNPQNGTYEERTRSLEDIQWYYKSRDGGILTKEKLNRMKRIEDTLWGDKNFQEKFCKVKEEPACIKPISIMRLFDGSFMGLDPVFNDTKFDAIQMVFNRSRDFTDPSSLVDYALGKSFRVTSNGVKASYARGSMSIGAPLEGYKSPNHDRTSQFKKLKQFLKKTFIPKASKFFSNAKGDLQFCFASKSIIKIITEEYVLRDAMFAIGSFLFIYCFMWFQTRSLFITTFAILSIVNGFVITDLVYVYMLGIDFIGAFHILSVFIILGIGADDVFVFLDTWTEARFKTEAFLDQRLDYTFKSAGLSMFYTSVTTALAFFVSGMSPFLMVRTFGIFTGVLVLVNYLSMVIFFPTCVVFQHIYLSELNYCTISSKTDSDKSQNKLIKFFGGPYNKLITHKWLRYVILGAFLALISVLAYFVTRLQVQQEQLEVLPKSTNIGLYAEIERSGLWNLNEPQRLFLVWGLKPQDVSSCETHEFDCYGKSVSDNKLSMDGASPQQQLLNLCDEIRGFSEEKIDKLKLRVSKSTNEPEINCFVSEMKEFLEEEERRYIYNLPHYVRRYPMDVDLSYPVDENDVRTIMEHVDYVYNSSYVNSGFTRWFETAMSFWIYNGFQVNNITRQFDVGNQYHYYRPFLGTSEDEQTVTRIISSGQSSFTYRYGRRLRYMAITVNLTLSPLTLGYQEGLPVRDAWEEWLNKQLKDMPQELQGGFQCTPPDYYDFNLWHRLHQQQELKNSAVNGILIGLAIAFPILIVATANIIVGFIATFVIGVVTLSVIAIIPIMGWKLGVVESLNLILVVGLSVDYCVHLAHGYTRCSKPHRKDRVQFALEEVGISVLAGYITSSGAAIFLMFAIVIFFLKFGVFIFVTLTFSLIYSLGFFMVILATIGPEHETGSLKAILRKIRYVFTKS